MLRIWPLVLPCFFMLACSSADGDDDNNGDVNGENDSNNSGTGSDNGSDTGSDNGNGDTDIDSNHGQGEGDTEVCQAVSTGAGVDTVYLAFAFDVSGSMGKGDYPWHDVTLKWDPITAATDAFLQDPASADLWASMTFFPADDDRCDDGSYTTPDVTFTQLPSAAFGQAMNEIRQGDWRGGTPTVHVMRGVLEFIRQSREAVPGRYAIVLVTDGYPQGCDDNEISSVVAVAEEAVGESVLTFVIGVNNPPLPDAPDTVSNLSEIGVAGATGGAFIINTGDPAQTSADFGAVVNSIRSQSVSCSVTIPPPPDGRAFDKQKVNVTYTAGGVTNVLTYDPDCATGMAWHYDDPLAPTKLELCAAACAALQNDSEASLNIEFTCLNTLPVV